MDKCAAFPVPFFFFHLFENRPTIRARRRWQIRASWRAGSSRANAKTETSFFSPFFRNNNNSLISFSDGNAVRVSQQTHKQNRTTNNDTKTPRMSPELRCRDIGSGFCSLSLAPSSRFLSAELSRLRSRRVEFRAEVEAFDGR